MREISFYLHDNGQLAFIPRPTLFDRNSNRGKAFIEFHTNFPQIYEEVKSKIFLLISQGFVGFNMRFVLESIRFLKKYKYKNYVQPFYTRLWQEDFPELAHIFKTCKMKED